MRISIFLTVALLLLGSLASCSQESTNPDAGKMNNKPDSAVAKAKTIIVDVRTREEWDNDGHNDCSVNYPLDELNATQLKSLQSYDKVILVCRSGNRAGTAKHILESHGFANVENKGSWQEVNCK